MEISDRTKKVLMVLGMLLVVIVFGYFIYFILFSPQTAKYPSEPTSSGEPTAQQGRLPFSKERQDKIKENKIKTESQTAAQFLPKASPIAKGGLTQTKILNQKPTFKPTVSKDGKSIQFYNKEDGKFYRINEKGEIIPLSDKIFYDVQNVTWSPNKNKAIIEYPDGANILYDFDTQKQITLPKHWENFDFSPDGDKIVLKSLGLDPDSRWLVVANEDGSKAKPIEPLGIYSDKIQTSWSPNNQIIAMQTEGIDFNRQKVYFIGLNGENFQSAIIEGRDFRSKWSPKGDKLLYSVYSSDNNMNPSLWVVNAQGDQIGTGRKNLKIETWADKCTFANDYELYCAVPENLPEGAGLFPELAKGIKDKLYKINIQTGTKKLIAIPDGNFTMSNLVVSDDGQYLYFVDENTQKLLSIKLK